MSNYRKLIAAVLGLAGTWLTTSLPDGISKVELGGLVAAALGAFSVWFYPNEPEG